MLDAFSSIESHGVSTPCQHHASTCSSNGRCKTLYERGTRGRRGAARIAARNARRYQTGCDAMLYMRAKQFSLTASVQEFATALTLAHEDVLSTTMRCRDTLSSPRLFLSPHELFFAAPSPAHAWHCPRPSSPARHTNMFTAPKCHDQKTLETRRRSCVHRSIMSRACRCGDDISAAMRESVCAHPPSSPPPPPPRFRQQPRHAVFARLSFACLSAAAAMLEPPTPREPHHPSFHGNTSERSRPICKWRVYTIQPLMSPPRQNISPASFVDMHDAREKRSVKTAPRHITMPLTFLVSYGAAYREFENAPPLCRDACPLLMFTVISAAAQDAQ